MAPTGNMFTPDMTADSATEVSRDGGSEDSRDEIEQLYSRLMRVDNIGSQRPETATNDPNAQFPQHTMRGGRDVALMNDPRALLASTGRAQSSPTPASFDDDDEDPRRMLIEIERSAPGSARDQIENNPRMLLAEIDRELSSSRRYASSSDHNLVELRRELIDSPKPSGNGESGTSARDVVVRVPDRENATSSPINERISSLPQQCVAHAIALILESADCGWEVARGWTTYLFSSGLDSYPAHAAKHALIERSAQDLDNIIQNVLNVEKGHRRAEERERLPCRLIISNVAAGAEEEDVLFFFRSYAHDIRDLKFLKVRDPVKRTKMVQLDMWSRISAVRASCMHGSIFGLKLQIELAMATEK